MGELLAPEAFQGRASFTSQGVLPNPPKFCVDDILAALQHSLDECTKFLDDMLKASLGAGFQVNLEKSYLHQK